MKNKTNEIKELINNRRMIEAKKELDNLKIEIIKLNKKQEFFDEMKNLARSMGKSNMITVQTIENLLVQYGE